MFINDVEIEDTYAEAFRMYAARLVITSETEAWALTTARVAAGFSTSVIGCGCEAGIEGIVGDTPDGRPGVSCLFFAVSREELEKQLLRRVGQGVMTAPMSACFNGLEAEKHCKIGGKLRFFGDGYQISKLINQRRFWRIPVMDGEFVVEETFGVQEAVGGGNFILLGENTAVTLKAAEAAVEAITGMNGVILPFPGGIVRSGSKVGSKYKFLPASSNTAYCPTLRGQTNSALPPGVNSVLEIVINGLDVEKVETALQKGMAAAAMPGVMKITAGNYGGNLGKYKLYLHKIMG